MTKQKLVEVRDDLNKLIDAMNPGSPRAAVARTVEKLDAILGALPDEPGGEVCCPCGTAYLRVEGGYVPVCDCAVKSSTLNRRAE